MTRGPIRVLNRRTHAEDMLEEMIQRSGRTTRKTRGTTRLVQEATNGHKYEKRENPAAPSMKNGQRLKDVRDWSALEKEWSEAAVRAAGERGKIETE